MASQSQSLLDLSTFITSAIKLKQDFFQAARKNRTECYLATQAGKKNTATLDVETYNI